MIDWVSFNIENAIFIWNLFYNQIIDILVMSPEDFKDGVVWEVMVNINGALQAIGLGLLVLFFTTGVVKTCGSFTEVKKPEHAFKLFVRFAIAKGIITYGMELMLAILDIVQGIIAVIIDNSSISSSKDMELPDYIVTAINETGFIDAIPLVAISLIGGICIAVLTLIMIMTVYGRFFKLYLFTALAPIPLSTFGGEPTQNIGKSFLKSYLAVCLQGAVIILGCIIFSIFSTSEISYASEGDAAVMLWNYIFNLIFNMLILVGTVKMADRVTKEMMGL